MRFQPGDRVMIAPNLSDFDPNEWPTINDKMMKMAGFVVTIKDYDDAYDLYILEDARWEWLDKWLCPLGQEDDDGIYDLDMSSIL